MGVPRINFSFEAFFSSLSLVSFLRMGNHLSCSSSVYSLKFGDLCEYELASPPLFKNPLLVPRIQRKGKLKGALPGQAPSSCSVDPGVEHMKMVTRERGSAC